MIAHNNSNCFGTLCTWESLHISPKTCIPLSLPLSMNCCFFELTSINVVSSLCHTWSTVWIASFSPALFSHNFWVNNSIVKIASVCEVSQALTREWLWYHQFFHLTWGNVAHQWRHDVNTTDSSRADVILWPVVAAVEEYPCELWDASSRGL